ncbi:TIGR04222 domain-containing membrane protein [Symmachiella macrocystis]|nr:TIGR04222 domain-containing membrane protein [Symmachiella macrocystis]
MPGPQFLVIYGVVVTSTLVGCWWRVHNRDSTRDLPLPKIPENPGPYKAAFLRGGENEVTRLLIFDLIQRGYLVLNEAKKILVFETQPSQIKRAADHPSPRHLSAMRREVFDYFSSPLAAGEIFKSLPNELNSYFEDWQDELEQSQLLTSSSQVKFDVPTFLVGGLIIVGLGGFKLAVALSAGRTNVGFLIAIGAISLLVLAAICQLPRLSQRGKRYLEELQLAFGKLQDRVKASEGINATSEPDPALLLTMGIFGVTILEGTAYSSFHDMFKQAAAGGSGGCGGGCGGGGGGCGGCGD